MVTTRSGRWIPGMVLIVLSLGACAATGKALPQENVNELAGHSIQAFVKERFIDAIRTIPIGEEKKPAADGSVLMEALFTDVNMMQIDRPSIELVRFCHAQKGKITRSDLNRPAERAAAEALRRKVDDERFCVEVAQRGEATEPDCRFTMARARYYEHVPLPRLSAAEAAQESLPPQDFGRFSCTHPTPAQFPDWDVVVEAVDFEPGQKGTLKSSSLTLLISPRSTSP